ncbi:MAG: DMT family transporter [Bacteroidales bacterium]
MAFVSNHIGELAALLVTFFWTFSALVFEHASKKVGSLVVNIIRLIIGFVFLTIFNFIRRGSVLPLDATSGNWIWLTLSGLVGFVFGDLFLFKSYEVIGSRLSMLIMTLVPLFTAFFGFIILGEHLRLFHFLGMAITFMGISIAIFNRDRKGEKVSLKLSPKGILYALGGAVGQSLGLVLSKLGMKDYDPFSATQIRIIAGIAGFSVLITLIKRWGGTLTAIRNRPVMKSITLGAFFGPFLGVSFSLVSIKYTAAGIASTIMALVPVFLIVPAIALHREKVTIAEIAGAVISVAGIAVFFI